jgi:hypothetical protein
MPELPTCPHARTDCRITTGGADYASCSTCGSSGNGGKLVASATPTHLAEGDEIAKALDAEIRWHGHNVTLILDDGRMLSINARGWQDENEWDVALELARCANQLQANLEAEFG